MPLSNIPLKLLMGGKAYVSEDCRKFALVGLGYHKFVLVALFVSILRWLRFAPFDLKLA